MKLKNILKKFYFALPHSNIYMLHHVQLEPEVDQSGCKLDTNDFYNFVNQHSRTISIPKLLESKGLKFGRSAYTFDDGLADVYTIAYPFLKSKQIPFTIFVLTDMLDTPGYLTTAQLLEMNDDPLVTIGAHGTLHRVLTDITIDACKNEIFTSKEKLERILQKHVSIFAYSHGQYNAQIVDMVKEAGYQYGFSVRGRPFQFIEYSNKLTLPRFNIDSTTINRYK